MEMIWSYLDSKRISENSKQYIFLLTNVIAFCVLGLLIWSVVSRFALSTIDWMICFIGYPGFFLGFIGGAVYLCRK